MEERNPRSAFAAAERLRMGGETDVTSSHRTRRWPGWLLLWAGWLIPQIALLGPALVGRTVDIPVDLLARHSVFLPASEEYAQVVVHHDVELTDLVFCNPAGREFFAKELRAGRLPTWNPNNFAGAPIVGWGYSPFEISYYLVPSPVTVAWISLLESLTVGLGLWLFLRRCLNLSYWAAALASWCAPLTGFMTLWHGFSTIAPVCWLPWLLVAIDSAAKRPRGGAGLGLAVLTALVLLAGHMGIAGLVLLTAGFYAVWQLSEGLWQKNWRRALSAAATIGTGWLLGFAISAAVLLPLMDYVGTGARMDSHTEGFEERPPQGLEALPAILRPDVYGGQTRANWTRTIRAGFIESSSSAYAGLLAALWLAPLAWSHARLRSQTVFWMLLVLVTLGWTLNVPGIVDVLRSRPLRPLVSLSYNRWVFATSEATLILAAIGLDSLRTGSPRFRWWWAAPIFATAVFLGWCIYRLFSVTRKLDEQGFANYFLLGAALALITLVAWVMTFRTGPRSKWVRIVAIGLLPLELFGFAWDERRQADRKLYFPRLPILDRLAALPPGRIWGVGCLPPNLNHMCGLEDIRGYDGVDPRNFIRLFELACDKERTFYYSYARTLMAVPGGNVVDHVLKLHPVADLLNVRYLIFREAPRSDLPILLQQDDYWIMENRSALPRAYVPLAARLVKSDDEAISRMTGFDFDPRKTVLMTDDLELPQTMRGTASVRYETPTRTHLDIDMQTPGMVLLSDRWDPGWRAELDGAHCPIYRVDLALRGFRVPAGKHSIVCTYDPASIRKGFAITAAGCAVFLLWWFWLVLSRRRARFAAAPN
ncbi:MAG TPA: hypothetical protein VGP76_26815 [Planctomycetaceae bacterium]|nr:hypothetical protein [Planctomycetaceae bacterium]